MQKVNYKLINTKELLDSFKADAQNVDLESGDIRLNSEHVYKFGDVLLDDNNLSMIDIAIDECDVFYFVDEKRNLIFTYDPHNDALKAIGCYPGILPLKLNTLSAIGVDRNTLYIADHISINGVDNARLIALAKKDFQIRWVLCKGPDGKPLNKILDIECDNKGNVFILENETGRILRISKENVDYPIPHLVFSPNPGTPIPKELAVDAEGDLYVLYEPQLDNIFYLITGKKEMHNIIPIKPEGLSPSGLVVDALNQIFIGESGNGSEKEISLKTIHKLSGKEFTPLWSYRGASRKLISDSKGNLFVLNDKGNKLTSLIRQKVNLPDKDGAFSGHYISKPIDSQTSDTRWHRLLLEGEFEKGTQIEFMYYVSNENKLDPNQWHKCISETSSVQGNKKRDALFLEDAEGRYLWFKIILSGTETRSPVVRKITVFFPRVSYLDYLPAIYREETLSKGLLERFLAIFESVFFDIDLKIEHMGRYFDACGTPPEFLSWLGSWLSLAGEEDWPEDEKRRFISKAVSLYKMRGTRKGLEESIELLTDKKPFIVEVFKSKSACKDVTAEDCNEQNVLEKMIFFPSKEAVVKVCLDKNTLKISDKDGALEAAYQEIPLTDILYGTERFGFCVILEDPDIDQITLDRIRRIIEDQKPAHTCYGLKVLQPWFYLDIHTYLGINTKLTKPDFVLGVKSVIGRDTVLDDEEQAGQVERHVRVGIDSTISW